MNPGGILIEHHSCDFFPERWFDLIFVLQADNTILYDRLEKRGYHQKKITENVECEIFQTILEEAKESYAQDIVFALPSNDIQQLNQNVAFIKNKIEEWYKQNN